MAAKKKGRITLPKELRKTTVSGALGQLQEAVRALRRSNYDQSTGLALQALKTARDPAHTSAAKEILAESHFRAAVTAANPAIALKELDQALTHTPDAPRLHFHRGLALWQLGRQSEAAEAWHFTARHEPNRPGLTYLRQLARLAAEEAWDSARLTPAEANTLRAAETIMRKRPLAELSALLQQPLLGKEPRIWQALGQMRADPADAPTDLLLAAAANITRRPISRYLYYYRGISAMRRSEGDQARLAWTAAQAAGMATPWFAENLSSLLRTQVIGLAENDHWAEVVELVERLRVEVADSILQETVGLAYFHLGYDAAQSSQWQTAVAHWRKANEYLPTRQLAQNLDLAEEALENWGQAAEAWRAMARRRPRKADHPDFLSDAEVAAIWAHAAECYAQIDNVDEQIVCLKTAAEYAPEDSSLRLKLADAMRGVERDWAAANQLEALLAADPNNVDALLRLAAIQHESWYGDPASLWRRVLAIDPTNFEAREGLAQDYLAKAGASVGQASSPFSFLARPFFGQPVSKDPLKLLENGLKELGEHPGLLLELGRLCAEKKQRHAQARSYLLRAFQADPNTTKTVGPALHEMLHASGGEMVEQLLPQARQMPGLLPAFWMDQARMVLNCKLGQTWAARFFDEGVKLAELKRNSSTPASVLAEAFEISHEHGDKNLAEWYEERVRDEAPGSGALDYIAGYRLYHEQQDLAGALRLMRKAKQAANKAHDSGVAALAEQAELMLPAGGSGGLGRLLAGLGRQGLLPDFLDDFEDDEEGW